MAVPGFQSFLKPLLQLAADGKVHSLAEARAILAEELKISEGDLQEVLPSGNQTRFENRVAWAKSYLVKANVFESPRRGHFRITDRGRDLLEQEHDQIDIKALNQYPEFEEFRSTGSGKATTPISPEALEETPEESLQRAYQSIRSDLASEVLMRVKDNSPKFFENLVVDLMIALGYGGSRADAGRSLGKSGDEGIDGIIKEDRLGLDVIYLQAKRWAGTVGRPEIQKFVGALHGKRAKKGVFITTGNFAPGAVDYVSSIDPKVILIDGRNLAELMIDNNLGVSATVTYEIKRVDIDYFEED